MLFIVTTVKLVTEIALLSLLGRWLLCAWLQRVAPATVGSNLFMWVLDTLSRPFVSAAAWVTPRRVARQHLPWVAFCLLLTVWLAATLMKIGVCAEVGMEHCR